MQRNLGACCAVAVWMFAVGEARADARSGASAGSEVALVDTLGAATVGDTFSLFGSSGPAISTMQLVGARFTLSERTTITELGGFVNNCASVLAGVPQCPGAGPLFVEIRREVAGIPDVANVLARLPLSHDGDPLVFSYESVATKLVLEPGTYFALFGAREGDGGTLLSSASQPLAYNAGVVTIGFVATDTNTATVWDGTGAAVRILGRTGAPNEGCVATEIAPLPDHDTALVEALNDWGQVAGTSFRSVGAATAFVWQRGEARPLERLQPEDHTLASAINDWGQIVGIAGSSEGFVPVLWSRGRIRRLPGEPGDRPSAINNRGQIAGSRGGAACLLWPSASSEPVVLGTLGGTWCSVHALNDRGEFVGMSRDEGEALKGFFSRAGAGEVLEEIAMPSLPAGEVAIESALLDINERGIAVGFVLTGSGSHAIRRSAHRGSSLAGNPHAAFGSSVNELSWSLGVDRTQTSLLLMDPGGRVVETAVSPGLVNAYQVNINDRFQVAWTTNDLKAYFCQF